MDEAQLALADDLEVYFLFSYAFTDSTKALVSAGDLEGFRRRLSTATPQPTVGQDVRFDNRNVYYSFVESFCTPQQMPLLVSVLPTELSVGNEASVINGELPQVNATPTLVELRLSQYGAASVRVRFVLPAGEPIAFNNAFLDVLLGTLKQRAKSYADAAWVLLRAAWNAGTRRKLSEPRHVDSYLILCSQGISVSCEGQQFSLADLKKPDLPISGNGRRHVEKMLVGLAISSYMWPEYTDEFVKGFLSSDLSTTRQEFQFVAWRNAFIYSEPRAGERPAKYHEYLNDMLLALELLFIIRTSLQILDSEIDARVGQSVLGSNKSRLALFRFSTYRGLLNYFDKWMLSLTGWKMINRYAVISHFHDFLAWGLQAMRIDVWLRAINEKIALLRDTVKVQSARLAAVNSLLLTLVLILLAVLSLCY